MTTLQLWTRVFAGVIVIGLLMIIVSLALRLTKVTRERDEISQDWQDALLVPALVDLHWAYLVQTTPLEALTEELRPAMTAAVDQVSAELAASWATMPLWRRLDTIEQAGLTPDQLTASTGLRLRDPITPSTPSQETP